MGHDAGERYDGSPALLERAGGVASSASTGTSRTTASAFVLPSAVSPACFVGSSGRRESFTGGCCTTTARSGSPRGSGGGVGALSLVLVVTARSSAGQRQSGNGRQAGAQTASPGTISSPTRVARRTAPRNAGPPRRTARHARRPSSATSVTCTRATPARGAPARTLSENLMRSSPPRAAWRGAGATRGGGAGLSLARASPRRAPAPARGGSAFL